MRHTRIIFHHARLLSEAKCRCFGLLLTLECIKLIQFGLGRLLSDC